MMPRVTASPDFAILAEVARLATEDIELRPMLQRITDALASRLGWDLVALVRVDANAGRFVCEALSSSLPTTLHVGYGREIGSGVVGEVAATARAVLIDDAQVQRARFGDGDAAIPALAALLKRPSAAPLTPALLRLDPDFDRLRADARFAALLNDDE